MNIYDVNLDIPHNEQVSENDRLEAALVGVLAAKQEVQNLLKRIEAIENWIINNSVPMYRPPECNQHLPLGKVLDDLYERIEHATK